MPDREPSRLAALTRLKTATGEPASFFTQWAAASRDGSRSGAVDGYPEVLAQPRRHTRASKGDTDRFGNEGALRAGTARGPAWLCS